jgi:hypothetical protein
LAVFAQDEELQESPFIFKPLQRPHIILPENPDERLDDTDEEDPYINDPSLELNLDGTQLEDGRVELHWEPYKGHNFLWYKIVHSQDNPEPFYPQDGYIEYFEDPNITHYITRDPLPIGDNYIRLCLITTDDRRGCSNVLSFYQEDFPEGTFNDDDSFDPEAENFEKPPRDEIEQNGEVIPPDKLERLKSKQNDRERPYLLRKILKFIAENLGVIATVLALIVAVSGFTFAARKKKRSISKYMNEIDNTYSEYKMKAKRCEAELYRLRDIIDEELKQGRLDESAYKLLLQRIENYMVEIQKQIVNEKFGGLPASLKEEMFKMMEDGEITEKEFEAIQTLIKRSQLSTSDQDSLLQTIKEFKHQDEMMKRRKN